MRSPLKELIPKEHGVWGWLGIPLVMALASAPSWTALTGAFAVVAGVGAAHGFGRAMRGMTRARVPTALALILANLLGIIAVASAPRPEVLVPTLGLGALLGFGAMFYLRGRLPRAVLAEIATIAAFTSIAAGLAVSAGAAPERVAVSGAVVLTWLVLGLWWIKRSLARVLSHRDPWRHGLLVGSICAAGSIVLGVVFEAPWVGVLPLLYVPRALIHRAAAVPADAKRIGLTELAWGIGVAVAAVLAHP